MIAKMRCQPGPMYLLSELELGATRKQASYTTAHRMFTIKMIINKKVLNDFMHNNSNLTINSTFL